MSRGIGITPGAGCGPVGCHCGKESRGWIEAEVVNGVITPPHKCRQCSPEHCEHADIPGRCEFGICVREAELELTLGEQLAVKVCGLHVSPVLGWGVAEPVEPRIRYLVAGAIESAADDRAA